MVGFSTSIDIRAAPDRVWAVLCDIERWPEWTSSVTSIQRLDAGSLAVGSRARVCQPNLPPAEWRVTELDEGSRIFTWVMHGPGVQVAGLHRVEAGADGSKVTLSLEFSGLLGPLIARFYRRLNERYLATEAQGLKKRSES